MTLCDVAFHVIQPQIPEFTPADDIVELHPTILADVDGHHFAPEKKALNQHPGEGGHEEEMEKCCHHEACCLQVWKHTT